MADSQHAHDALVVVELVDDPVAADPKRAKSAKSSPKEMTCLWFALKETEGLDNAIGERPVEIDDLPPGSPGELGSAHLRRRDRSSWRSSSSVTVSPRSTSLRPSSMAAIVSVSERISAVSSKASYSFTGTRTAAGRP